MISDIKARAAAALQHKDLSWIMREVPARYRDNPAVIGKLMAAAAAGNPRLADTEAFQQAHAAVGEFGRVSDLADRVARLYHDPRIAAEFGDQRAYFLGHPEEAYRLLIESTGSGSSIDKELRHELTLVTREAADFNAEHGNAA